MFKLKANPIALLFVAMLFVLANSIQIETTVEKHEINSYVDELKVYATEKANPACLDGIAKMLD